MANRQFLNQKFGRLTVIEKTDKKQGNNCIYKCKCDCGNIVEVSSLHLGKDTNSCGCLKRERAIRLCELNKEKYNREQMKYYDGTQITQIQGQKPYSTNKLGIRGVYKDGRSGKYVAKITVKRKSITLGCFTKLDDAIKARKAGEEKYFKPIMEDYKNDKSDSN